MTVTIMIDGSVIRNRKFGFKLQSSQVIEKRYNVSFIKLYIEQTYDYVLRSIIIVTVIQKQKQAKWIEIRQSRTRSVTCWPL